MFEHFLRSNAVLNLRRNIGGRAGVPAACRPFLSSTSVTQHSEVANRGAGQCGCGLRTISVLNHLTPHPRLQYFPPRCVRPLTCDHAHGDACPLARGDRIRHLLPHRVLDSHDGNTDEVLVDLISIVKVVKRPAGGGEGGERVGGGWGQGEVGLGVGWAQGGVGLQVGRGWGEGGELRVRAGSAGQGVEVAAPVAGAGIGCEC